MSHGNQANLLALLKAIEQRNSIEFQRILFSEPELAKAQLEIGATRQSSSEWLRQELEHYLYSGDTALHAAATIYNSEMVLRLLQCKADVHTRNRRGAVPLHYGCDGGPTLRKWNPDAQYAVVKILVENGTDPNCIDKSGVAALHRAVRQRCTGAVRALIEVEANVRLKNGSGSTPLHLAVQNTGRGGSGAEQAKAEQIEIIQILIKGGAKLSDKDGTGRIVMECIRSKELKEWIMRLA